MLVSRTPSRLALAFSTPLAKKPFDELITQKHGNVCGHQVASGQCPYTEKNTSAACDILVSYAKGASLDRHWRFRQRKMKKSFAEMICEKGEAKPRNWKRLHMVKYDSNVTKRGAQNTPALSTRIVYDEPH